MGNMSAPSLVGIAMVISLLAWVSYTGINKYIECTEIQGDPKYDNRKMYLSHVLTIGITFAATLILRPVLDLMTGPWRSAAPPFFIISGIAGLISSIFSYQIISDEKCEKDEQKHKINMGSVIAGIIVSCIAIIIGFSMFMYNADSRRYYGNYFGGY